MKVHSLPASPRALLLDFDSTLYTNPAYAAFQNEVLIERLARERGEAPESTRAVLEGLKARIRASGVGGEGGTSLGNLFLALGVAIETSVAWREELIEPADWLGPDPELAAVLRRLARRFSLALVTNNPASVGIKGLEALGLTGILGCVVGLDDSLRSKPDPAPYALAARRLGVEAADCISVGDRHEVDIVPALSLGMGGILVTGVEEVKELPAFFDATYPQA
jgi:HAD superfamily hydrolase (TIGR01509 family)